MIKYFLIALGFMFVIGYILEIILALIFPYAPMITDIMGTYQYRIVKISNTGQYADTYDFRYIIQRKHILGFWYFIDLHFSYDDACEILNKIKQPIIKKPKIKPVIMLLKSINKESK